MNRPIYPIVRGRLAVLFRNQGANPEEAVRMATSLITMLRRIDMDIVMSTWIDGPKEGKIQWEDLPEIAAEWAERRPWNPPELN